MLFLALAPGFWLATSCAHTGAVGGGDGGDVGSGSGGGIVLGGSSGAMPLGDDGGGQLGVLCTPQNPCSDFPLAPVMDPNGMPPANAAQLFAGAASGSLSAGPCIVEPESGSLYPKNWLRPRVFYIPGASSQNLFEIRFHSPVETNDLVVYTTSTQWVMDKGVWTLLASKLIGTPITVIVRGVDSTGGTPAVGASADFTIAPATANGAMIYWTTASFDNNATTTTLQGFHVGDEGTTTALTAGQVVQQVRAVPVGGGNLSGNFQNVFCIGCHTATPDGKYVAFTAQWPWPNALATIQADAAVGAPPPWLSNGAVQNLSPDYRGNAWDTYYAPPAVNQVMLGIQTFSPAHYANGDRIVISQIGAALNSTGLRAPTIPTGVTSQLAWFDLEWQPPSNGLIDSGLPLAAPCSNPQGAMQGCTQPQPPNGGWGVLARVGDSNSAGGPNWSHDGTTIAYASTDTGTKDGRMDTGNSDIKLVPYNGKMGGTVAALSGASDPSYNEYYPAFSPDDKLVAFNRVPSGVSMYSEPRAEVFVVPATGGSATRLAGNDPPACTGLKSPGVQNTWPKWAPKAQIGSDGKRYYWVTFSSTRHPKAMGKQQLYVVAVVLDPQTNKIDTYGAIYLWNQSYQVNNLIPSWENLEIAQGTMQPPR
jgi:hypothetical protein